MIVVKFGEFWPLPIPKRPVGVLQVNGERWVDVPTEPGNLSPGVLEWCQERGYQIRSASTLPDYATYEFHLTEEQFIFFKFTWFRGISTQPLLIGTKDGGLLWN